MALWLVRNFDTCSCSLPLANSRMRVTKHDVRMTLELIEMIQGQAGRGEDFRRNFIMFVVSTCLYGNQSGEVNYMILNIGRLEPNIVIELGAIHNEITCVLRSVPRQLPTLRGWTNDKTKDRVRHESISGFGRGYLGDMLDKMGMTDEEKQVNEGEHHSKSVEDKVQDENQTVISKVKVSQVCLIYFVISSNRKQRNCTSSAFVLRFQTIRIGCFHEALFRDGRAAADLIITNIRLLAEVITELEDLIPGARIPLKRVRNVATESMNDALTRDRPKTWKSRTPVLSQDSYESEGFLMQIDAIEKNFFAIPSFSLRVSQEEKESLPKGVVVDSQLDILVVAAQVINCDVEDVVMRCMVTSAQCISTPLLLDTSSRSLASEFSVAL
ncbi:hypothetical protein Cgig2_001615 [Carnegiea gigantea]|uniref:Uncharacterized protein n=1 Tax=Carnegiea gigantea TaxID=171969 RepID=A0A9Q1GQ96_9CARY|nr:hypothetical protein Cgig2_001615 [Carnegiea gigantea]